MTKDKIRVKTIFLLLSLVLIISLVAWSLGCAPQSTTSPTTQAPTQTQPAPSATQAKIKWTFQTYTPQEPVGAGAFPFAWARDIPELTNGQLSFDVALPGAIVPVSEMFTAVSTGTLDAAFLYAGFYQGIVPETFIETGLPFAWPRMQDMWHAFYEYGLLKELQKVYAEKNVYYVSAWAVPMVTAILSKNPIPTSAAIKGVKFMATIPSAAFILHDYLGAETVNIPGAEKYQAVKSGTVDAAHIGIVMADNLGLGQLIKYVNPDGMNTGCSASGILINMNSWNKLPANIRNIVDKYTPYIMDRTAIPYDEPGLLQQFIKKNNLTVTNWTSEEKAKILDYAVNVRWKQIADMSPRNAALVDIVKKQLKDTGRL